MRFYKVKPLAKEERLFGTTKENLNRILNFRKERNEATTDLEKIISLIETASMQNKSFK